MATWRCASNIFSSVTRKGVVNLFAPTPQGPDGTWRSIKSRIPPVDRSPDSALWPSRFQILSTIAGKLAKPSKITRFRADALSRPDLLQLTSNRGIFALGDAALGWWCPLAPTGRTRHRAKAFLPFAGGTACQRQFLDSPGQVAADRRVFNHHDFFAQRLVQPALRSGMSKTRPSVFALHNKPHHRHRVIQQLLQRREAHGPAARSVGSCPSGITQSGKDCARLQTTGSARSIKPASPPAGRRVTIRVN